MIFRYTFPVPHHGALTRHSLDVEVDEAGRNPTRHEIMLLLDELKEEAEIKQEWIQAHNWEGCLYAVKHAYVDEFPELPQDGIKGIPVFCDTPIGKRDHIQITIIEPKQLPVSKKSKEVLTM